MTQEELNVIIERHGHWIKRDCDGWERMRMVLRYEDLRLADLSCANLSEADLSGANLSHANLNGADLSGANLNHANLSWAKLIEANLSFTDLSVANLSNADISGANLSNADIGGANLSNADLRHACLFRTYLRRADLNLANLSNADLYRTDLSYSNLKEACLSMVNINEAKLIGADILSAKDAPYIPMACPDSGSFIGWKKCRGGVIVKLEIPEDARRSSGAGRKCRCDKAIVLGFEDPRGNTLDIKRAVSLCDAKFFYDLGEPVSVSDFCTDRFKECGKGIHFFINREEAVWYNL